jgi:hypothetical protein
MRWVAAPVALVCAAALVIALLPREPTPAPAALPLTVSEGTLGLSRALVTAPVVPSTGRREPPDPVPHAALSAVAAGIAAHVPYPPGAGESMDWARLPADPRNMGSVNFRSDVQFLVEYRAACTWAAFWLYALQAGNEPALVGATAVLGDVPYWPTQRSGLLDHYERTVGWPEVARSAGRRDPAYVREYARANCRAVPSPYSAAIR